MMNTQSGAQAFPRPETPSSSRGGDPGMTLPNTFAAAALQGICAGGALATAASPALTVQEFARLLHAAAVIAESQRLAREVIARAAR
jgi:hypothetical protein